MNRWSVAALMIFVVVAGHPGQSRTQDSEDRKAAKKTRYLRVRALDSESRRVLTGGLACSPSIVAMVAQLETTDLIVTIDARPLRTNILGELRVLDAMSGVRYVRVTVRTPNGMKDLISVLGHELQHALEVAAATEVRDAATQRALYHRIGYERMDEGYFETDAALKAGRRVAAEASHCQVPR